MNRALICDPASSKKSGSDYTAMAVVAKAADGNIYLLDGLRDRLNLKERAEAYLRLHRRWQPQYAAYERFGMQADVEYIRLLQERENYRFDILEVGGQVAKTDRVNRLIPIAAENRLYLPESLHRTLADGKTVDLVSVVVEEELVPWPVPVHDDFLDAMSRIFDIPDLTWPRGAVESPKRDRYAREPRTSWMAH